MIFLFFCLGPPLKHCLCHLLLPRRALNLLQHTTEKPKPEVGIRRLGGRRKHEPHFGQVVVELGVGEVAPGVKQPGARRVAGKAAHVTAELLEGDPTVSLEGVLNAEFR